MMQNPAQFLKDQVIFIALLAVMALAILPGVMSLPPIDRDEAMIAQGVRQMLDGGDIITPKFQDQPVAGKSAGIYWLEAISAAAFGKDEIIAYRLPSIIAAITTPLMVFFFARRLMPDRNAAVAAMLMGVSTIMAVIGRLATPDAVMVFLIVCQQWALLQIYAQAIEGRHVKGHLAAIFWLALALGIMVKGLMAPSLAAMTIMTLVGIHRDIVWLKAIRVVFGVMIISVVILPWAVPVIAATDGAFITDALYEGFVKKLFLPSIFYAIPPLTYTILLPLIFWPGGILVARAISGVVAHRHEVSTRFLLAWLIPFWLVIELLPAKQPHYFLAVLPALAMLIARYGLTPLPTDPSLAISKKPSGFAVIARLLTSRRLIIYWEYIALACGVGLGGAVFVIATLYDGNLFAAIVAVVFALAATVCGWRARRAQPGKWLVLMAVMAAAFHATSFGVVAPYAEKLHIAPQVKTMLIEQKLLGAPVVVSGYREPSLVFVLGEDILLFQPHEAAVFLAEAPDGVVIIEEGVLSDFLTAAVALKLSLVQIGSIEGYHYVKGETVRLSLFKNHLL